MQSAPQTPQYPPPQLTEPGLQQHTLAPPQLVDQGAEHPVQEYCPEQQLPRPPSDDMPPSLKLTSAMACANMSIPDILSPPSNVEVQTETSTTERSSTPESNAPQ